MLIPHRFRFACVFVLLCAAGFNGCQTTTPKPAPRVAPDEIAAATQRLHDDISREISVKGMSMAEGIRQFYAAREQRPVWNDERLFQQLAHELDELRFDGLEPDDYGLAQLREQYPRLSTMNAAERADFDIRATHAMLLSLVHLYQGKIDPKRLDARWNFDLHALDPQLGLQATHDAINTGNLAAVFERARPTQRIYRQLREGLRRLYTIRDAGGWPRIPGGPAIKPGVHDARIPTLRQRLAISGLITSTSTSDHYDADLQRAVKQFQHEQLLDADGVIGAGTLDALNVPVQARIDQIRANLERGRWQLHEIEGDFVLVDIAGYGIQFYRNSEPVWTSRVQVGKPFRSTPIFKSRLTYMTLNPTWTIPPTIFKQDVLPQIRKDASYLAKHHLRVLDSAGRELDAAAIDWQKPGNILLRQDAGPENPLGALVIRFPNPYSVYMHDTTAQANFSKSQRTFSSGCIRVERPRELATLLLNDEAKWNRDALDAEIAKNVTRDVGFKTPVPLLLMYWTVGVADSGNIAFRQDIYQRDPPIIAALDKKAR